MREIAIDLRFADRGVQLNRLQTSQAFAVGNI